MNVHEIFFITVVLLKSCFQNLKDLISLSCQIPLADDDIVILNGTDSEIEKMVVKIVIRADRRKVDKKNKKNRKNQMHHRL